MESDIQLSKIAGRIIGEKMDTFVCPSKATSVGGDFTTYVRLNKNYVCAKFLLILISL